MQIENQVTYAKVVSISYLDYLQYCRDKFGIVESKDGVDEIQAIVESVVLLSSKNIDDRAIHQLEIRAEVTKALTQVYRDAANYLELLQAHLELLEKEKKEKEYREHAQSMLGH